MVHTQIARFMWPTWGRPVVPRWAPCWPHEPCYQGIYLKSKINYPTTNGCRRSMTWIRFVLFNKHVLLLLALYVLWYILCCGHEQPWIPKHTRVCARVRQNIIDKYIIFVPSQYKNQWWTSLLTHIYVILSRHGVLRFMMTSYLTRQNYRLYTKGAIYYLIMKFVKTLVTYIDNILLNTLT